MTHPQSPGLDPKAPDVKALRRLHGEASALPWRVVENTDICGEQHWVWRQGRRYWTTEIAEGNAVEDAALIVAAVNALPSLLGRLEQLEVALNQTVRYIDDEQWCDMDAIRALLEVSP